MRLYVAATFVCVMAAAAAAQDHPAPLGKPDAFLALPPAARVTLVNFALNLARTFVDSDDFKRRYADHREANAPDPLPEEQTADSVLAKQREGFENQVTEMRKMFDQITPEQRATLEEGWKDMRDQFTAMEKGDGRTQIDGLLKEQRADQVRQRDDAMKEFDKAFPPDHRTLVAMRLRHFLEATKDVTYDAQLVDKEN